MRQVEKRLERRRAAKEGNQTRERAEGAAKKAVPLPMSETIPVRDGETAPALQAGAPSYYQNVTMEEGRGPVYTGEDLFSADAIVDGFGVQILGVEEDVAIVRTPGGLVLGMPVAEVREHNWYQESLREVYDQEGGAGFAMDMQPVAAGTNQEREAVNIMKRIGVAVEFFKNKADVEGNNVAGLVRTGNVIGIDVSDKADPVTRVVSHEATHAIERQDPELFNELADVLEQEVEASAAKYEAHAQDAGLDK
jgi:hypothetical protein